MAICSRILQAQGEKYPRTCEVHGLFTTCPDPSTVVTVDTAAVGVGLKPDVSEHVVIQNNHVSSHGAIYRDKEGVWAAYVNKGVYPGTPDPVEAIEQAARLDGVVFFWPKEMHFKEAFAWWLQQNPEA
jgi:hypothetical protein